MKITASLVLYRNNPAVYEEAIRSVIGSGTWVRLVIVDNSPTPLNSALFDHPQVVYDYVGANIGFGAGHNRAFAAVAEASDAHFIVNPDVQFAPAVIDTLVDAFRVDVSVTAVMPAIYDQAGQQQHLCKALPTPMQLIGRRFVPSATLRERLDRDYEFRDLPQDGLIDIPNLSGCFLGVRSAAFRAIGGFDERYFMYMEDIDLVRRLGDCGRTVYVPAAKITHAHARGSYRVSRLMVTHIHSAVRYFNKFGWVVDTMRTSRNRAARQRYRSVGA